MKQKLLILLTLFLLFIFPQSLLAAGFQLKTVGSMSVEGATYNQLWYSSTNVTFTGTALANATVTATINGASSTITADASGNWSHSATLNEGDNTVSFESDGSTVSFTLTIGALPEGVGGLPEAATPTAGIVTPTLALFLMGGSLLLLGLFFFGKSYLKVS